MMLPFALLPVPATQSGYVCLRGRYQIRCYLRHRPALSSSSRSATRLSLSATRGSLDSDSEIAFAFARLDPI